MIQAAFSGKGARLPDPIFIPRPGQKAKRKPTKAELRTFLTERGVHIIPAKRKKD